MSSFIPSGTFDPSDITVPALAHLSADHAATSPYAPLTATTRPDREDCATDPVIVAVARSWLYLCTEKDAGPDLTPGDVDRLTSEQVIRGIENHWAGGLHSFLTECADEIVDRRAMSESIDSLAADPAVVAVARDILSTCADRGDLSDLPHSAAVAALSADQVIAAISRHWEGGLYMFQCENDVEFVAKRTEFGDAQ